MSAQIEQQLTGGHPNSLGNTIAVVDAVLADHALLPELFECYNSKDEVVRLRVSNAMKRLEDADHALLLPYLDRFLDDISQINQASTKWTLAQLFMRYDNDLSDKQREKAIKLVKNYLTEETDWIVLNFSMESMTHWATKNDALKQWLIPVLKQHCDDSRKSVKKHAEKFLKQLGVND